MHCEHASATSKARLLQPAAAKELQQFQQTAHAALSPLKQEKTAHLFYLPHHCPSLCPDLLAGREFTNRLLAAAPSSWINNSSPN